MSGWDPNDVQDRGENYGWYKHDYQWSQGQLMILRKTVDGESVQLNIWCTTGTVGSYLQHPRQGKTQLFRRNIDSWEELDALLMNPRTHTGSGYHRRPKQAGYPCPGCGKICRSISGTAGHFESGACPSCPGRENALQAAYGTISKMEHGGNVQGMFTSNQKMLTGCIQLNQFGELDYTNGYEEHGYNYNCPGCRKRFRTSQALLSHCEAKPECRHSGASQWRALGY